MPDSLVATAEPRRTFSVGSTLRQTFAQLSGRLPTFLLLAMLPGVPELLYSLILLRPTPESAHTQQLISTTSLLSLYPFAQGGIIHATFQSLRGRPVTLRESLSLVTPRFRSILLASLLSTLLIALGSILLLVPGIMLLARYFVVIPVCLIEGSNASASLKRSAELTAGSRWKIFGLFLLMSLAVLLSVAVMVGVSTLSARWIGTNNADELVGFLIGGALLAFSAVLSAVTYHELRFAKEGVDGEQIAAVFD
ncbi:MAG TPA: glycerophosphoryl diester phosphodiesterase membrane domain-containing protein [Aliidongia sp.]|nr:glycerophosphoryl diester phosphodiesterase membrane domain-containing protein [Aliidongia sp.]